jgi:hypothetical protein
MSSQLNFKKVRRVTGGSKPSSDQKILPVAVTKGAGVWRGQTLSESAYTV